jgi:hypothetical protein
MPTLCAAAAPDGTPAGFYGPSDLSGLRGPLKEMPAAEFAHNDTAGKRLFDDLEELSGIRYVLLSELSANRVPTYEWPCLADGCS